jgi:lipopolysaccharide transport system permease protein
MYSRYIELMFYRAYAELTRDLKRAYLGFLWWFIEPVLYMAVFYLIFGEGLRKGGPDFVVYLLTGLIIWKWLDGSVRSSANVIISSVGLMNHVYIPKILLPAMVVIVNTYKLATVLIIFLLFLVFVWGIPVTHYWQFLPLLLLLQLILIFGMAGIAAAVVPVIPDLKYIIEYGMTMAFFLSGIFFDIHELTPEIQNILMYNPMVVLIESYRDILLYARWPNWHALLIVSIEAAALFGVMLILLIKLDRYYPRAVG